jgi:hypothetical protein
MSQQSDELYKAHFRLFARCHIIHLNNEVEAIFPTRTGDLSERRSFSPVGNG